MCGIIGYTGKRQAAPILLDGLKMLEYRGYDSSGIAVSENGGISMTKAKGRLDNLVKLTDGGKSARGTMGIGHTRWATHGEPSDVNSHPHIGEKGNFALVHNGIIENYLDIRAFLCAKGFTFRSQTDTEAVVQLLEYYYKGDVKEAIAKTLNKLRGSYALGILTRFDPDTFYAVRKDSPLVIGLGDGENFIASDMPAVLKYTHDFILPEDGDIAVISPTKVELFNRNGETVEHKPFKVDWDVESAEKGGFPHFMLKEIHEQPKALEQTLLPRFDGYSVKSDGIEFSKEYLGALKKIFIVACGSSYHAAMVGKYFIERNCRISTEVDLASEFRYRSPVLDENTLTVVISQSGETADTIAAMRDAKAHCSRVLAIVNVVGSTIAREADDVLYTRAGPEIAVATTKGYTTQVATLMLLGLFIADATKSMSKALYEKYVDELKALPAAVQRVLDENVEALQKLAYDYFAFDKTFFIGRGMDYALALEGALKLKEISYIHAESYAAGELKHGTISLIEKGSPVIACATGEELFEKTLSNIKEVRSRGASVIALVKEGREKTMGAEAQHVISLPALSDEMMPCVAAAALQLFAYYVAAAKSCDIDKPRNLAKAVTVE